MSEEQAWRAAYPFDSCYVATPHGQMHYLDEGPERGAGQGVVVMVHGNPTWSFYYRRLIERLRATTRCVVPDHIGCGLSEKPQSGYGYRLSDRIDDLARLIDEAGLERVSLVVHDWGGAIGLGWAGRYPERVERLVITNTGAFRADRIPLSIDLCRIPGLGELAVRGFNGFALAATRMATTRSGGLRGATRQGYLAPYDSWAHRIAIQRFVEDIPTEPEHPSWSTLGEVEAGLERLAEKPILILWGERDFCFTPWFRAEFERRFPRARSIPFPEAGHYLFEDGGEPAIEAAATFLEEGAKPDR